VNTAITLKKKIENKLTKLYIQVKCKLAEKDGGGNNTTETGGLSVVSIVLCAFALRGLVAILNDTIFPNLESTIVGFFGMI
jgi:hypothetical protein